MWKIKKRVEFEYEMTEPLIYEKILWIYKLLLKNARHRSGGFSFKTKGKLRRSRCVSFGIFFRKIFSMSTIELKKYLLL